MKSKKKGSAIVMILAISIVFIIVAGIILTSVSSTLKGSIGEKNYEDLLYAAESGIDMAYSHLKNGGSLPNASDNYKFDRSKMSMFEDYNEIDRVEVRAIPNADNKRINIISTAFGKGSLHRTVKAAFKTSNGMKDIFKYSAVSTDGDLVVDGTGSINLGSGNTSLTGSFNSSNLIGSPVPPNKIDNNEYPIFEFNQKVIRNDKITLKKVDKVEKFIDADGIERDVVDFDDFMKSPDMQIKENYGLIKFTQENGSKKYNIYIANSDNINIEIEGTENFINSIFITNGSIQITKGTLFGNNSSIIAKDIHVTLGGSITLNNSPQAKDESDFTGKPGEKPIANLNTGHEIKEKELMELHKKIERIIPNWRSEADIEIEEDSFEYE